MLSASSRMMSLNCASEPEGGWVVRSEEDFEDEPKALKICFVLEKVLICSLGKVWHQQVGYS